MRNSDYWKRRAEEIAQIQYDKADEVSRKLYKEYEKADKYIEERIKLYYQRYALDYGVSYADAKKILNNKELKSFKMTLEEFREKAINNKNNEWTQDLDEVYLRSRISRLESLKTEITNGIEELKSKQLKVTTEHLKDVFEDTYYRTGFEFDKLSGMTANFSSLNDKAIEKVMYSKWTNQKNFAGRIDDDKATLLSNLNKVITQGLITGSSSDEMVNRLMKATKISRNRAINLIQTETTFVIGQANTQMYKEFGVDEYEVIETLDSTTCETCAMMDGKRFKVSEKQEGLNSPPFHPRCRGTTVPISKYEDIWGESDRIARDDEGKTIYVGDITYEEYIKQKRVKYEFTESIKDDKINNVTKDNIIEKLNIDLDEYDSFENDIQERVAILLGYDRKPVQLNEEQFKNTKGKEVLRVVHSYHGKTAQEAYNNTLNGAIRYSESWNSTFGRGIYFGDKTVENSIISAYSEGIDNKIIHAKISSDAKILEFNSQAEYIRDVTNRLSKVKPEMIKFYEKERSLLYMLDGIDGIKLKYNNYYCIYNRGVLMVNVQ